MTLRPGITVTPLPIIALTTAFVGTCMVIDVRTRRIPNTVSVPMMVGGIAVNGLYHGAPGALASLGGFLVASAILLAPFAVGGIGGGDVKMMAAVGALLGPRLGLASLLAGMLLGGLVMVVHLARRERLGEKVVATGRMFAAALGTRTAAPLRLSSTGPNAVTLPYSVPLGVGTVLAMAISTALGA